MAIKTTFELSPDATAGPVTGAFVIPPINQARAKVMVGPELDVGARIFITPSIAVSLEAGWLMYDDHYRVPAVVEAQFPGPSSTALVRMGPIAELGFEVFRPEPK